MKKELSVFLALALLLSNSSLVFAQPCAESYYSPIPSDHNPLTILVAYDEEMAASLHHWKDRDVDAKTYVAYQLLRAFHWYPFQMRIGAYEQWDSDDRLILNETFYEVVRELNWYPGSIHEGVSCDLLVAFTGQDNDGYGGGADAGFGAAIIKKQDWVPDDNTVMHEMGHLFGLHHCNEHCVMSEGGQYWLLYNEPLSPIEEGYVTLAFFRWEYYCYLAYEFCPAHWESLKGVTRFALNGTKLEMDPEWNEAPKRQLITMRLFDLDLDPEWNSSPLTMILVVGLVLSLMLMIVITVIIKRRWKGSEWRCAKKRD